MKQPRFKLELFVYQKIIILFAALILSVYLINLWINMTGLSFIKQQVTSSITTNAQFYSKQLNDQISFIRNQQLQALNDSDLQKLSFIAGTLEGYEEVELVNRVKERIATVHNSSAYIVNAGVYIKSLRKTISTKGGISALPNEEFDMIDRLFDPKEKPPIYQENEKLFFIEPANNASIILYLELSRSMLLETLRHLVDAKNDSGALLADDSFQNIITLARNEQVLSSLKAVGSPDGIGYYGSNDGSGTVMKAGNQSYRVTYNRIGSLGLTLYTYMNQSEITGPLKKFNVWFGLLSAFSVIVIIVFSLFGNVMIHKPLKKLIKAFQSLETDNLDVLIEVKGNNEFGYLYRSFNRMAEKLKQSIRQNYEQKIALQLSELKQLQSQINPHFLYNSFFNIYMICKSGDVENASTLAQKLGSYYQFVTRNSSDEVPLMKEYRHAIDYCEIQNIRFSNRIEVDFDELPDACKPLSIPRLIIQPVVENAFEHAFENGLRRGRVRIKVAFADRTLRIGVEDDGDTLTAEALRLLQEKLADSSDLIEKTGLLNVGRRIRLRFGDESGVFLSRSPLGGLHAEIVIQYRM
ncbi:sensor histidine kinase [Paenibacillus sp. MBLB4367]|uniref:sensor histidine kinase n=1 Tax=Paenibacillus sp. MBLB4367 TaxID=3384767 RepID=UPI0039080F3D